MLALAAIVANLGVLRAAGAYLRQIGANTNADVAALDLGRGSIPPGYVAEVLPDHQYVPITAGGYFAAERALGTPADSIAALVHTQSAARTTADQELIGERAIVLSPGPSSAAAGGSAPAIVATTAGTASRAGPCSSFAPQTALAPGAVSGVSLRLAPGVVRVTGGDGPVTVAARRFGPAFTALGTIGPDRAAYVLVRRDAAPQPWVLQLQGAATIRACTLRSTPTLTRPHDLSVRSRPARA